MKKLAVFFPGIGYTKDKPLLYYSRKLAMAHGFDIIQVDYGNLSFESKGNRKKVEACMEDAWNATVNCLDSVDLTAYQGDEDIIIFFSKSIGTVLAARYAKEKGLLTGNVYYTPLEDTFSYVNDGYGIAFSGDADQYTDSEKLMELAALNHIEMYMLPDADHSLETGDVLNDMDYLADIMEMTEEYIRDCE